MDGTGAQRTGMDPALKIVARLTFCIFLCFAAVGIPLPILQLYVHHTLGYGNFIVGMSVGIQFLATILTRGVAGREVDANGSKPVVIRGMILCAVSGLALVLAELLPVGHSVQLAIILLGRLMLGLGESQLVIGMFGWCIGTVGAERSGIVLAWCGMAMYGSVAAAAPLGFWLYNSGGLALAGLAACVFPALAAVIAWPVAPINAPGGPRGSFLKVIGQIWQPGSVVMLQGVGYAAIGAFISLDFATHHWSGTGLALSCFGGAFVLVRIFAGHTPARVGPIPVALVSLSVELVGQLALFGAPVAWVALLGAALTGAGCSMIFPSMGVLVVRHTPPQIRATALGGVSAFQDVAYGLTGPIAGIVASGFGYPAVFAMGAGCAVLGLTIAVALQRGGLGWGRASV